MPTPGDFILSEIEGLRRSEGSFQYWLREARSETGIAYRVNPPEAEKACVDRVRIGKGWGGS